MKRAFIVIGAESSGTRLVTRILMAGGCHGEDSHFQKFDEEIPEGLTPIVWRRSVPHSKSWPILSKMLEKLPGYNILFIVTVRDLTAMEKSQVENGHVSSIRKAAQNIMPAYIFIFKQLVPHDYVIIPYESLVLHPVKTQQNLFNRLGLNGVPIKITNENAKWL